MFNREKSDFTFPHEKDLAAGVAVSAEGMLLVGVMENGVEKVAPAAGAASEVAVGFSLETRLYVDKEVGAKEITVPATAPYTVQLPVGGLITGQVRIPGMTVGVVADGVFAFTAAGLLSFDAAQAGEKLTVFYKRTLTMVEARELYREGFLHNSRAFEVYGKVGVIAGKGIIYTDQIDMGADFTAGGALKTMAGGLVTVGGAGAALPAHVRVIEAPSLSSPFLGLEFNF